MDAIHYRNNKVQIRLTTGKAKSFILASDLVHLEPGNEAKE
jgi:hypothetical protein